MRKFTFFFKSLLAAFLLLGGANSAWGVDVNFAAKERISVNGDGWKAGEKAGNKYALAIADLTGVSGISDAGKVTIEFDVQMNSGGRWLIGIGDKAVREETAGTSSKSTYDTNGLVCRFGTSDGVYYRVNGSNSYAAFGKKIHVTFSLNRVTGKYSLVLLDTSSDTELYNQSGVSTSVSNATIIEAYSWNNNDETLTYLKSASVTVAPIYSYTIKAIDGSSKVLKTFDTGSYIVGDDAITYNYPQKLLIGNTLYSASDSKSKDFNISFTPNTNDYTANVSYSGTSVSNVIYYSEAENISGVSSSSDQAYASMKKVGRTYTAGDPEVYKNIITLPAGTYKIYARGVNSNSADRTCNFKVGDEVKWTFTITKSSTGIVSTGSSADITVASDAMLSFSCGASNQSGLDWIYITGTPTNEIVGAVDCSTYYLEDMTEKVTLKPGESYNYKFVNHNKPSYNVNGWNWVLPVYASGAAEPTIVLRQDNWEDKANSNNGCSLVSKGTDNVWDDFINEMNGATVDMTVNYTAGKVINVSCDITTSTGKNWAYTYASDYDGSAISFADNVDIALAISNSWAEVLAEGKVVNETLNTNMSGYKTFYNATTDYQVDEHTTIYKAAEPSAGKVVLTDVGGNKIIKAGQPVILHTSEASIVITPTATESTGDFDGNALQVADGSENNKYVLGYTSANGFGFYYYTATLPAGYIFLDGAAPNSGVKVFSVVADGTATGVETPVAAEAAAEDGIYYNLNGQQVTKDYKGIVIVNGKKFLNK